MTNNNELNLQLSETKDDFAIRTDFWAELLKTLPKSEPDHTVDKPECQYCGNLSVKIDGKEIYCCLDCRPLHYINA